MEDEMIGFKKYQGTGNDFILMKDIEKIDNLDNFVIDICDRRFGVGADGFMYPGESEVADVFMHFYNSDGLRADMCGNGLRCFSKYVYNEGIIDKKDFTVETLAGIMEINLEVVDGEVVSVTEKIGTPVFTPSAVPVTTKKDRFINETVKCSDREYSVSSILMGVPHTVVKVDSMEKDELLKYGMEISELDIYPVKINVNFTEVLSDSEINVDTWERGIGNTLACGTGSCASVYILNHLGMVGKKVDVNVPGGRLNIEILDGDVLQLTGPAEMIYEGTY